MRKMMLLGMGRSGTHAVIQWIANGMGGVVRQENNCFNGWKEKKLIYNSLKITGEGEAVGIIKSIDDFYLPLWDKLGIGGWEEFECKISVIRSPRNWLASSIATGGWANEYLDKTPNDEKESPVNRIEGYKYYRDNSFGVRVNYDKWCLNDNYRGTIANMLGITNNPTPKHCKFSSFGKNHDYTGDRYELLNKKQKKRFDKLFQKM